MRLLALLLLLTAAAAQPLLNASRADVRGAFRTQADAERACSPIFPGIKADQLCDTTGLNSAANPVVSCSFQGAAQSALFSGSPVDPICFGYLQAPGVQVSKSGQPLPYPLVDARPLQPTLPQHLTDKEGASLYWLYRVYLNYALWARCAASTTPQTVTPGIPTTGDPTRDFLVPPGWTPYSTLWLEDGSPIAARPFLPFATIFYKGTRVLVVIRSSASPPDWLSDFDYTLTAAGPQLPLPGKVHRGIHAIAATLWPGLKSALFNLRNERGISTVYVSGHSLGGGVGAMLAYAAQEYLDDTIPAHDGYGRRYDAYDDDEGDSYYHNGRYAEAAAAGEDDQDGAAGPEGYGYDHHHHHRRHHKHPTKAGRVRVDAALFAPAGVGDATFAAAFARRVNARRLAFLYDTIPQVPCSPMVACPSPPVLVATNDTANGPLWAYAPMPGSVTLLPSGMPTNAAQWSLLQTPYDCEFANFISATHTCSYLCYFSRYVEDTKNLCLLAGSSTEPGSCFGFPSDANPDYPATPPS